MKVYGNLMNRISEHTTSPVPEVGMGATIYHWSDRTPATVTKVSPSGKTVELTEDRTTEWSNDYGVSFAPNPSGVVTTARLTKNGTWKADGNGVSLGKRNAYYDRSF